MTQEEASLRILPSNSDKVSLGVYCEAMCPYCSLFYKDYLFEVINDTELSSIVDIYIAPWGQTEILKNGTWDCMHGAEECLLNTVEACAINAWPNLDDHYPFIHCVESLVYDGLYSRKPSLINQWPKCFQKLALESKDIEECVTSGKGVELELEYAAKTLALEPPVEWVPWVVVDGKPISYYPDVIGFICDAYKGAKIPKACTKKSLHNMELRRGNQVNAPVCSRKTPMSLLDVAASE